MSKPAVEKNLARFNYDPYGRKDGKRFCLLGLLSAEVDDARLEYKRGDLLEVHERNRSKAHIARVCTIGSCEVSVIDEIGSGRTVTGECVASGYCLKEKFEESGDESKSREERQKLYRSIMDTCLGYADRDNAGNFCPKIDCELSAGFSIDGNGGVAGECNVEIRKPYQQLTLEGVEA